ncbi:MAG: hypothetical protein F6J87_30075 [Spirulina sp. SIO3F2]|nr:hypothetical protein [Spirulina sp. SIO3F2]
MPTISAKLDPQQLIRQWMLEEQNGELFPVDFDLAWQIAGYSTKASAKRHLVKFLDEGIDFSTSCSKPHTARIGRPSQSYFLTTDSFKHFCLMSNTGKGRQIRQYFIEAEKQFKTLNGSHQNINTEELGTVIGQALATALEPIATWLDEIVTRVEALEQRKQPSLKLQSGVDGHISLHYGPPTVDVPPRSRRTELNELVKDYAFRQREGTKDGNEYRKAWNALWREVRSRLHVDVKLRAANRGVSNLDYVEAEGLMEQIYSIAVSLFVERRVKQVDNDAD